ncbi:unnamed protein product [Oikopleura dioica]|uniref:Snake toxin/toxin-like domain-containing protein n=1 Tax=Oikopleura dioica TaxID=34765 RepID=E4YNM1_OIKDI|nr:unnamed protein product [Oikopleura dioica]
MLILLAPFLFLIGSVQGGICSKKNCHNCHSVVQYKKGPPPLIQKCSMLVLAKNCCSTYFMSDHMSFSQQCKEGCVCANMSPKDNVVVPIDIALSQLDDFYNDDEDLSQLSQEDKCEPIVNKSAYKLTIMALLGVLTSFFAIISYGFYKRNSMNPASGKLRRKKNRKSHDVKSSLTATAIHAAMTSSTIADMSGEPTTQSVTTSNSREDDDLIQVKISANDKRKISTVTSS